jgi:site-specific DNA recombinase
MSDLRRARVAVYARYSTDRQNPTSCSDQIAKCDRYVRERGGAIDLAHVYRDDGVSGAVWDRPGFGAMLDAVRAGKLDVIVAEDLSRISRHTADSARFRDLLTHAEVRLLCIDNGLDTASEGSELMGDMFAAFGAQYRREVGKKTLRGLEGRALAGFATGALPYGYRAERVAYGGGEASRIVIDEDHAAIVREIFALHGAGQSLGAIARTLNARGVEPPRETKPRKIHAWGLSTVRAILHNARYIGAWSFGARKWSRDPDTRKRRPKLRGDALVTSARPDLAIVDRDAWDRTVERFARTRLVYTGDGSRRMPRGNRQSYALSGLLFCAECGAPMTAFGGDEDRGRYYRCSGAQRGKCGFRRSFRERIVREVVIERVRSHFGGPSGRAAIREAIARRRAARDDVGKRRRELDAAIERDEAATRRLVRMVSATDDPPKSVVAEIRTLEARVRDNRAALERLATEATPRLDAPDPSVILDRLATRLAGDPNAVREALRDLLDGERVEVVERDGKIYARGGILTGAILGRDPACIAGAGFEPTTFGL